MLRTLKIFERGILFCRDVGHFWGVHRFENSERIGRDNYRDHANASSGPVLDRFSAFEPVKGGKQKMESAEQPKAGITTRPKSQESRLLNSVNRWPQF